MFPRPLSPVLAFALLCPLIAAAQSPPPAGAVSFNQLGENIEVKALLEYISKRLKINIAFDDQEVGKTTVNLRAPNEVPADQVLPLVESVLRMKGLALVDGPIPGWKRVIPIARLADASRGITAAAAADPVVTRFIPVRHASPESLRALINPFLSHSPSAGATGGTVEAMANPRALIVTDFAHNIDRIATIIESVDQPNPMEVRFVTLTHGEARIINRQLTDLMTARAAGETGAGTVRSFRVISDERANQLALVGSPDEVDSAQRMLADLDKPIERRANPVQSYPLANTSAESVLATIQRLEGDNGFISSLADPGADRPAGADRGPGSPQAAPAPAMSAAPTSPATGAMNSVIPIPTLSGRTDTSLSTNPGGGPAGADNSKIGAAGGGLARVTADLHTNSIIVAGPPHVQKVYAALITMLDVRRPQVLIDIMLVTIDTTDDFQLGVDIGGRAGNASNPSVITFSRYGIGTANPATGGIVLPAALASGFTGAILGPSDIDIVVHALQTTNRARITSGPRVLVNDNAIAKLSSIAEEPVETSVLTSTSVATESFGGFEKAGTIIKLQPHISQDDYLQLDYEIELSSFVGDRASSGLPPARRTDVANSTVTIPNGSTIIVGGVNNSLMQKNIAGIPFLSKIPLLEYVLSDREYRDDHRTFFVFIRPVILRDHDFKDLRYYSDREAGRARVPGDAPRARPIPMR